MDITCLIAVHERVRKEGDMIWEQFVTLAEASDADSMLAEEEEGHLNRNAVVRLVDMLEDIYRQAGDDELRDEIKDLITEIRKFLASKTNAQ